MSNHTPWSVVKAEHAARLAAAIERVVREDFGLMDKLKTAHVCPSVDSGNPADCAFGGEGCMSESQIKKAIEDS